MKQAAKTELISYCSYSATFDRIHWGDLTRLVLARWQVENGWFLYVIRERRELSFSLASATRVFCQVQ